MGGRYGRRVTVGVPGTGVYYTQYGHHRNRRAAPAVQAQTTMQPMTVKQNRTAVWVAGFIVLLAVNIVLLGIPLLVEIPLAIYLVLRHRRQPAYTARQLIKQATLAQPAEKVLLLHQALQIAPNVADIELTCGNLFYDLECWWDAAQCYGEYLHHESSLTIEAKYAQSLLRAGEYDQLIERLQSLRSRGDLTNEAMASLAANLAAAFLLKNDASQALAIVDEALGKKRNLDGGLRQCLAIRGVARYKLGQVSSAVKDFERLYALDGDSDHLEDKAKMLAGTYEVTASPPQPDWYPTDRLESLASTEEPEPAPVPNSSLSPLTKP